MQLAFIPPNGLEDRMHLGHCVMGLAQRVAEPGYAKLLQSLTQTHFTILDNGACEGEMVDNDRLRLVASVINARELVLPDVLGKERETVNLVTSFLKETKIATRASYMAVVQGNTMAEIKECVLAYASWNTITTIGIPRLLVGNNKSIRIDLANWIVNSFNTRFKIHLLGTHPSWVREVYFAARYAPHIRSVDTSMPYNYALAGVALDKPGNPPIITRPPDFYTKSWHGIVDMALVKANEEAMLRWVSPVDRSMNESASAS